MEQYIEGEEHKASPMINEGDPKISFVAMTRLQRLDTFKTFSSIKKRKVLVMTDPRSTLNILDVRQVKKLDLYMDTSEKFPIIVPGDLQIICEGVIWNVELRMGVYMMKDEFYVTKVGGVDVVLGV